MLITQKRYDGQCREEIAGAVAEEATTALTETVKEKTTTEVDEPANTGTRGGNDGSSNKGGC